MMLVEKIQIKTWVSDEVRGSIVEDEEAGVADEGPLMVSWNRKLGLETC